MVKAPLVATALFLVATAAHGQQLPAKAGSLPKVGDPANPTDAQRITNNQVEMTTYVSERIVAPGKVFSIVADVTPRPGTHVYAPGARGYRVVVLRLDPQPFLRARTLRYPPSEVYVFKPLNERVQVFGRPFRLVQDVSFDASPEARAALGATGRVTITGALEYQACDDRTCFLPKSVPVTYSVTVRQGDAKRTSSAAAPK